MKGFLIGPDNERFEADIVRYFKNVNDHYLIYTKGEKDANGYILLYAVKVISDNGIKIGEDITDGNEWSLIKSFLQKTVSENKEGRPVTIEDCNPVEINDLKINSQRPFKLSETAVDLFGKNKKSFEIVQKMMKEQNTVKIPVAPEVPEFVLPTESTNNDNSSSAFNFEFPSATTVEENSSNVQDTASVVTDSSPIKEETATIQEPIVAQPVTPLETQPVSNPEVAPTTSAINYEELYKHEVEKNEALNKEIEQLLKDNAVYKEKIDKLKELLG